MLEQSNVDVAKEFTQLIVAQRGYEGTAIEEIAQRAKVSKPVVYEHFGGKEGLYAVVVDRDRALAARGDESRAAAVQVGGPRRQPERLRAGPSAGALRGVLLASGLVPTPAGEAGEAARDSRRTSAGGDDSIRPTTGPRTGQRMPSHG